jgi:hypothetical protein
MILPYQARLFEEFYETDVFSLQKLEKTEHKLVSRGPNYLKNSLHLIFFFSPLYQKILTFLLNQVEISKSNIIIFGSRDFFPNSSCNFSSHNFNLQERIDIQIMCFYL